jgi:ribosomal protein S18 acetylase RimI-like enzyme
LSAVRNVRITSEPMAAAADTERVIEGLNLYNVAQTGQDHWRYVKLFVRDGQGLIRGGLIGHIWGGWLHITDLWLEKSLRGSGLGRSLMETAETEARDEGCRYVHLDSHSFQAPDFYKKLGYEEFGRLKDSPLGHEQVFLWKRL